VLAASGATFLATLLIPAPGAMIRIAAELLEDVRKPDGAARQSLLQSINEFAAELAASHR
jgi:hypothetical protein